MKRKSYMFNILLAVVLGVALAVAMLWQAFYPAIILPPLDVPLLQAVSLLALLAEHWIAPNQPRSPGVLAILAAMTFGLLPMCAGFTSGIMAVKLGVAGGVTGLISVALFDAMVDRISDTGDTKLAPIISAFVLFLAGQCFTTIFF